MYKIAELGSNHDNDLQRAKDLIHLAKEGKANAVKFQHFTADSIINKKLASKMYDVYKKFETPLEWIPELAELCKKLEIDFMSTPYNLEALEKIDPFVNMHKIGSGDINYYGMLIETAKKKKPVLIGAGASNSVEVIVATNIIHQFNPLVVIMQSNCNYSGDAENYKYSCINTLKNYRTLWPYKVFGGNVGLGISDHTKNNKVILAAQTLGAEFVERHFTDGKSKSPDNDFAMTPIEWKYMVNEIEENAFVLGNTFKEVQTNEFETRVIQRRCLTINKDLKLGHTLTADDIDCLRPAPMDSLPPIPEIVIGKKLERAKKAGDYIREMDIKNDNIKGNK